jgi:hypothetical protein
MKTSTMLAGLFLCLGTVPVFAAGHEATTMARYDDESTGLAILRAEVSLPSPGYWFIRPGSVGAALPLAEIFLKPTGEAEVLLSGRRTAENDERDEMNRGGRPLSSLYRRIQRHTKKHGDKQPESLEDIDDKHHGGTDKTLRENYHILFDVRITQRDPGVRRKSQKNAAIFGFETKPPINDGKHWVLLADGRTERREINQKLFAKHGATLTPGRTPWAKLSERQLKEADYLVYARIRGKGEMEIEVENSLSGDTTSVRIDPSKAAPGKREMLGKWATQRMWSLPLHRQAADSTILPHWWKQAPALYGVEEDEVSLLASPRRRGRRGATSNVFGVLGGRAAIRETLQMQAIAPNVPAPVPRIAPGGEEAKQEKEPDLSPVPISEITGVEVKSHPFEEMLGDQQGGRIELAEVIPVDRLLAYFPQPKGLVGMLDGGAEFLFQAGSSATGRSLEYGLADRYLASLGMDRTWMRRLLDSGAIEETAIAVPDLFFIDGSELTVVARLKNPMIAGGLLRLLGIKDLSERTTHEGSNGEISHWARRDDLLIISSDGGEMDKVLALHAAKGEGSLGRSAELRYMLTKLPLQESTRAFVYLSDPFIRQLVGPQTKISQYRRIHARSEMEGLVAGSLLHRLDGHKTPADAAELIAKGYVAAPKFAVDAKLDPELGAVSETFGALPRMNSLSDLAITEATAEEAAAYANYLTNYKRFWRRFFDPIALRVDQPDPAGYELSVFILPLIDNSLYGGLRQFIAGNEQDTPLRVPQIEPEPVATLSVNLREEAWVEMTGDFGEELAGQIGLDSMIFDLLGPDLHLAIADGDPILEMGSGELTGMFGVGGGMDDEMFMIPALVSMFTRPTALCVGLTDPDTVRRILNNAVGVESGLMADDFVNGSLYKIAGRDGWVYRIDFFGVIKLRLGVEIQDRFLVIRNQPLSTPFQITGVSEAAQPGARMAVSPTACRRQLPALFASAAEREREAALGGISHLHPLLATGASSIEDAADTHKSWFGFRPVHPRGGEWAWDGEEMSSNRYGKSYEPTQPDYTNGDREFGLLRRVNRVEVNMRFEDDGLRTTARWQLRKPGS